MAHMEAEIKVNSMEIMEKLTKLQASINYIQRHVEDITLTEDDIKSFEIAEKEFENGETTSLRDLKKELGM